MSIQPQPLTEQEHRAVICICILAAFADGAQDEVERSQIERILNGFSEHHVDLMSAYQDVLGGKLTLPQVASQLQSPAAKALAYEMAVCVCQADGVLEDLEKQFLVKLRQELRLDVGSVETHQQAAQTLAELPVGGPAPPVMGATGEPELDRMILNSAILNGALEIMPHSLATLAIIPLQMRMVYQVGKHHGYELDRGHITDFLATVGIGLTSQVFEGFMQRLIGGLTRKVAGRLVGGLIGQAAGSTFAFATTYALGQVAKRYYASGRTLNAAQLKEVFSSLLQEARGLQGRYSGAIAEKSREVNVSELLPMIREQPVRLGDQV